MSGLQPDLLSAHAEDALRARAEDARARRAALWTFSVGLGLFGLIGLAVALGWSARFDLPILGAAPALHGAVGDALAIFVSRGMGFTGLAIATVALAGWLYWRQRARDALLLAATMMSGAGLMWLLKLAFERTRPMLFPWLDHADGFSFPSGHAFMNTVFWLMFAIIVKRPWARALGVVMAFLGGAFRVVAGVHYPSDVLAGWSLGVALIGLALMLRARFPMAPASAINTES